GCSCLLQGQAACRTLCPVRRDRRDKPGDDERMNCRRGAHDLGRNAAPAQSSGSTLTMAPPWLLPTHSTGRGPPSCTNTRRMLVVCGNRYSTISSVRGLSRETWSLSIEPVHTSFAPLVGTTS